MTTRTCISLRSGDRAALEDVTEEVQAVARRKGAQLAGPHSPAPTHYSVPQYKRLGASPSARYGRWEYTVYERQFELTGHDQLVRTILDREYPAGVQVEIEIEQR